MGEGSILAKALTNPGNQGPIDARTVSRIRDATSVALEIFRERRPKTQRRTSSDSDNLGRTSLPQLLFLRGLKHYSVQLFCVSILGTDEYILEAPHVNGIGLFFI